MMRRQNREVSYFQVARVLPALCGLIAAAVLTVGSALQAFAGNCYWNVGAGNWSTASNWSGTKPTLDDYAYIQNGGTATITQNGEAACYLYVGGTSGSGAISMSSGSLTTSAIEYIGHGGTGMFVQSGGTNNAGMLLVESGGQYQLNGGMLFGPAQNVNGTFTQSAGTNSVTALHGYGTFYVSSTSGDGADYTLYGSGVLSVKDYEYIGSNGAGSFSQSGGTNTTNMMYIGHANFSDSGTYTLSDGLLSLSYLMVGYTGAGTFTQSGGVTRVSTNLCLANITQHGTYNLNGGTLIVSSITYGSDSAAFNFGGGTLQAAAAMSCSIPMTLTGTGGNANINTAGNAVTLSGSLSGNGGLNKLGAGTLTLGAVNTYKSATTVANGTLVLGASGSISACSIIKVQNGATFDVSAKSNWSLAAGQILCGNGTVSGAVVAAAGSHIAPGESIGTLWLKNNLYLVNGALLDFDLGTLTSSDKISMTASTLYLHNQAFSDFTFTAAGGFGEGTYTLIDAGAISNALGSDLSGTINGRSATLGISGNDLVLTVVPEPGTWVLLAIVGLALAVGKSIRLRKAYGFLFSASDG
jgi:autotransporter-associated beta strand protein